MREAHPEGAKALQLYVWRDRVLLKEVRHTWWRLGVGVGVRVGTACCSRRCASSTLAY